MACTPTGVDPGMAPVVSIGMASADVTLCPPKASWVAILAIGTMLCRLMPCSAVRTCMPNRPASTAASSIHRAAVDNRCPCRSVRPTRPVFHPRDRVPPEMPGPFRTPPSRRRRPPVLGAGDGRTSPCDRWTDCRSWWCPADGTRHKGHRRTPNSSAGTRRCSGVDHQHPGPNGLRCRELSWDLLAAPP